MEKFKPRGMQRNALVTTALFVVPDSGTVIAGNARGLSVLSGLENSLHTQIFPTPRAVHGLAGGSSADALVAAWGGRWLAFCSLQGPGHAVSVEKRMKFEDRVLAAIPAGIDSWLVVLSHGQILTIRQGDIITRAHLADPCLYLCACQIAPLTIALGSVMHGIDVVKLSDDGSRVNLRARLVGHKGSVFGLSCQHGVLASCSDDRSVLAFNVSRITSAISASTDALTTLQNCNDSTHCTDGNLLNGDDASSSSSAKSSQFSVPHVEPCAVLKGHRARVWRVCVSSHAIYSAGEDSRVLRWPFQIVAGTLCVSSSFDVAIDDIRGLNVWALDVRCGIVVAAADDCGIYALPDTQSHSAVLHAEPICSHSADGSRLHAKTVFYIDNEVWTFCGDGHLRRADGSKVCSEAFGPRVVLGNAGDGDLVVGTFDGRVFLICTRAREQGECFKNINIEPMSSISAVFSNENYGLCQDATGKVVFFETSPYPIGAPKRRRIAGEQPVMFESQILACVFVAEYVILGLRNGEVLALRKLESIIFEEAHRIKVSDDAVTCIYPVKNPNTLSDSASVDCGHTLFQVIVGDRSGRVTFLNMLETHSLKVWRRRVSKGPVEALYSDGACVYAGVFEGSRFVLRSIDGDCSILNAIDIGGSHRSWRLSDSAELAFVKKSQAYRCNLARKSVAIYRPAYHVGEIRAAAVISKQPLMFATGGEDGFVCLFTADDSSFRLLDKLHLFDCGIKAMSVAKGLIVCGSSEGELAVVARVEQRETLKHVLYTTVRTTKRDLRVMGVAAFELENGRTLVVSAESDGQVRIWRQNTTLCNLEMVSEFDEHPGHCALSVCTMRLSNGCVRVVSGGTDGVVSVFDVYMDTVGERSHCWSAKRHQSGVNALMIVRHDDVSTTIASGGDDGAVSLCSTDGRVDCKHTLHHSTVTGLCALSDDMASRFASFASVGVDQKVVHWKISETIVDGLELCVPVSQTVTLEPHRVLLTAVPDAGACIFHDRNVIVAGVGFESVVIS